MPVDLHSSFWHTGRREGYNFLNLALTILQKTISNVPPSRTTYQQYLGLFAMKKCITLIIQHLFISQFSLFLYQILLKMSQCHISIQQWLIAVLFILSVIMLVA